jgi:Tfp pilus assembly protein PilO
MLSKLQQDFDNIDAALFDPVKANEFFSDLQVLSEAQNCLQNSLTFMHTISAPRADLSAAQGTYIIPKRATWNVVGVYKDLAALMNTLQNNAKQVWIDSLSIRPISNSDMLNCEATITLYVIYNKEERFDE